MKQQGYNDRLDERLGMKDGAESTKTQTYRDRRDESRGADKRQHGMTDLHHHRGQATFQSVFAQMERINKTAGHNSKCNHPAGH
jgi:hypothetical protein